MVWVENRVVGFYRILVHLTLTTSHHIDGEYFGRGLKMVGFGCTELRYISTVITSLHILSIGLSVWVENRGVGFYGILVHHREYIPPLRLAEEMIGLSVWVENRGVGFYGIPVHLTVRTSHHFNWPKK